jgi:hypothetical protein
MKLRSVLQATVICIAMLVFSIASFAQTQCTSVTISGMSSQLFPSRFPRLSRSDEVLRKRVGFQNIVRSFLVFDWDQVISLLAYRSVGHFAHF